MQAYFAGVFHQVPWLAFRLLDVQPAQPLAGQERGVRLRARVEYMDARLEAPRLGVLQLDLVDSVSSPAASSWWSRSQARGAGAGCERALTRDRVPSVGDETPKKKPADGTRRARPSARRAQPTVPPPQASVAHDDDLGHDGPSHATEADEAEADAAVEAALEARHLGDDEPGAVLVTGICGRLGKLLVRRLHRTERVVGIDRRRFPRQAQRRDPLPGGRAPQEDARRVPHRARERRRAPGRAARPARG
ncbi:MAG: hypothetical protein IPH72_30715 [Sandaracinaceae bacterium]|nr:hypothetical protein [Sandaracinaceae bacterium]